MPAPIPSAAQLDAYRRRNAERPVVLFYRFGQGADVTRAEIVTKLAALAAAHRGRLRWSGTEEQVLIGVLPLYRHCARLHFATRAAALEMVQNPAHGELFDEAGALEIAVLNEQPRGAGLAMRLMALALPRWPFFDNRADFAPEPGIGTRIMPTQAAYDAFVAHPDPQAPVVMVNWLRFRERAEYPADTVADGGAVSGRTAYYRYGKRAFVALHSLDARALFVSRYRQMLVGNGGDPGVDLWHEFAMVEYPGRAGFRRMTALRRYRAALHHRAAGLADDGQGLVVTTTGV